MMQYRSYGVGRILVMLKQTKRRLKNERNKNSSNNNGIINDCW